MTDKQMSERLSAAFNKEAFYTNYRRSFSIVQADTEELREACYRLRYDVYVEENGFIAPSSDHSVLERDRYDEHAVHYLLMHHKTGRVAGTVRVILPNDQDPQHSFPMQESCDHPILHDGERAQTFCQISRLCMHRDFRRRDGDGSVLPSYFDQEDIHTAAHDGNLTLIRRRIPYAPLGLFQAAFETALRHRITDCLLMVDPVQLRHFNRMGISYSTLGPKTSYHGGWQPVVFNIKNVLDTMLLDNPGCWDVISDMGRVHKIANNLYLNDWQDHIMDDLDWDAILARQS